MPKSLLLHRLRRDASTSLRAGTAIALQEDGQGNGSTKMLRITVHDYPGDPGAVVLQLEGRVAVPWLPELQKCWQRTVAGRDKSPLTIDVTAVTFIDAAGKACLTAMHREGATFVACDCLTKSVVEEITRSCAPRTP